LLARSFGTCSNLESVFTHEGTHEIDTLVLGKHPLTRRSTF
jgi:hypothetical protein